MDRTKGPPRPISKCKPRPKIERPESTMSEWEEMTCEACGKVYRENPNCIGEDSTMHPTSECIEILSTKCERLEEVFEAAKIARQRGQATPEMIEALKVVEAVDGIKRVR